jgi:hypothetical protein
MILSDILCFSCGGSLQHECLKEWRTSPLSQIVKFVLKSWNPPCNRLDRRVFSVRVQKGAICLEHGPPLQSAAYIYIRCELIWVDLPPDKGIERGWMFCLFVNTCTIHMVETFYSEDSYESAEKMFVCHSCDSHDCYFLVFKNACFNR